jgi:hypothetical protein
MNSTELVLEAAQEAYWDPNAMAPSDASVIAAAVVRSVAVDVVLSYAQYAEWEIVLAIVEELTTLADSLEDINRTEEALK